MHSGPLLLLGFHILCKRSTTWFSSGVRLFVGGLVVVRLCRASVGLSVGFLLLAIQRECFDGGYDELLGQNAVGYNGLVDIQNPDHVRHINLFADTFNGSEPPYETLILQTPYLDPTKRSTCHKSSTSVFKIKGENLAHSFEFRIKLVVFGVDLLAINATFIIILNIEDAKFGLS